MKKVVLGLVLAVATLVGNAAVNFLIAAENQLSPEQSHLVSQLLDAAFNSYVEQDFPSALANFQKVLEINPKEETALKGIDQCKKRMNNQIKAEEKTLKSVRKSLQKKQWLDAIDQLNDHLAQNPGNPAALELLNEVEAMINEKSANADIGSIDQKLYLGIAAYLRKDYYQATQIWGEVEKAVPSNSRLHFYIDRANTLKEETARKDLMSSGPSRAEAAFQAGRYGEAEEIYKKLLQYKPDDAVLQKKLQEAQIFSQKEQRQKKIAEHYDRGVELFLKESWAASQAEWDAILAIDPDNQVAQDYQRRISKKAGPAAPKPAKREADAAPSKVFEDLPELAPRAKKVRGETLQVDRESAMNFVQGVRLYKSGKFVEAVRFFDEYLRQYPKDDAAVEWMEKVKAAQEDRALDLYNQGLVAYAKGDIAKAVEKWQQGLKVSPNHVRTLKALSKVRGE